MSSVRLLYPILIVAAVVATHFIVERFTHARCREELREIDTWPTRSYDERFKAHTEFSRKQVITEAARRRNAITFAVGVTIGGALLFGWIDDQAGDLKAVVAENRTLAGRTCNAFQGFVELLDVRVTEEIRVKQSARDDLALAISDTGSSLSELPGYATIGPSLRTFLEAALAAQIEEARIELSDRDGELRTLRAYVDDVRAFGRVLSCDPEEPGS